MESDSQITINITDISYFLESAYKTFKNTKCIATIEYCQILIEPVALAAVVVNPGALQDKAQVEMIVFIIQAKQQPSLEAFIPDKSHPIVYHCPKVLQ